MCYYKKKIEDIIAKMYSMVPHLLPENRRWAGYYRFIVYQSVAQFTQGLEAPKEAFKLGRKFAAYTKYEEARIKKNLETIKYDMDALDTVQGVVNGRIEKVRPPSCGQEQYSHTIS